MAAAVSLARRAVPRHAFGEDPYHVDRGHEVQHPERARRLKLDRQCHPGRVERERGDEDQEQRQASNYQTGLASDDHSCRETPSVYGHDDWCVDKIDEPHVQRPLEWEEVVLRRQCCEPRRIHDRQPPRKGPRSESPETNDACNHGCHCERHTAAAVLDRYGHGHPDRKPQCRCRVKEPGDKRPARSTAALLAQKSRDRERATCKRELPRMEVGLERVRPDLAIA